MTKRRPIRPGDVVGRRSPKDDSLPHQRNQRAQTTKAAGRGRTEPRRGPTPPKGRRSSSP
jgi:hypothetical protein